MIKIKHSKCYVMSDGRGLRLSRARPKLSRRRLISAADPYLVADVQDLAADVTG